MTRADRVQPVVATWKLLKCEGENKGYQQELLKFDKKQKRKNTLTKILTTTALVSACISGALIITH